MSETAEFIAIDKLTQRHVRQRLSIEEVSADAPERFAALYELVTRNRIHIAPLLLLETILKHHPEVFQLKPETLLANVMQSAERLGVTQAQFVAAALKQPQLFYQKPETLSDKKPYIMAIAETLDSEDDFSRIMLVAPVALSLGTSYLHARFVMAKLGLKRGAVSSVIVYPTAKITTDLITYYQKRIAATGKGTRTLQVMHAAGLINALPEGIEPIMPRPRQLQKPGPV